MESKQEKIAGIILAAGSSERMGRAKQLLPFQGKPLLQHILDNVRCSTQLDLFLLLLGCRAEEIKNQLETQGINLEYVSNYFHGQSASLRCGLNRAEDLGVSAALILLGDQPLISSFVIDSIVSEYRTHRDMILIPTCKGKRGNPVLVDACMFSLLREIQGDVGGRAIFPRFESSIREVEISGSEIHTDVDTMTDYIKLQGNK